MKIRSVRLKDLYAAYFYRSCYRFFRHYAKKAVSSVSSSIFLNPKIKQNGIAVIRTGILNIPCRIP